MSDADPRSAEPVPSPPYEEEPSTTGLVADQQTALEDAVEDGDPDGSAAAGA